MGENLPIDDELLVRYIDGTVSDAERSAVESKLKSDAVWQEQLERLQAAKLAIQYVGTAQQVRSLHSEMMKGILQPGQKGKLVNMNRRWFYLTGAAACIILVFFAIRLLYPSPSNPDEIYQQVFVDYSVSNERGTNQQSGIAELYQQKEYAKVISSATLASDQQDSLLVGISALKISDTKNAIKWLAEIKPGSSYYHDAEYYLALAYLKNKQYSEAVKIMKTIESNPNHIYHQQVKADLIRKMEALQR